MRKVTIKCYPGLKMINEPQNYLRRYPFILNERHSSVGKVIENTYSMRTRHKSANDKMVILKIFYVTIHLETTLRAGMQTVWLEQYW